MNFKGLAADIAELLNRSYHRETHFRHSTHLAEVYIRAVESTPVGLTGPRRYDTFRGLWRHQRDELQDLGRSCVDVYFAVRQRSKKIGQPHRIDWPLAGCLCKPAAELASGSLVIGC